MAWTSKSSGADCEDGDGDTAADVIELAIARGSPTSDWFSICRRLVNDQLPRL
jgi:hypothetical protein